MEQEEELKIDVLKCIKDMQPTYTLVYLHPVCSDFFKLYIFEFPEKDSIIQPRIAAEGTYINQSSERNYQGNSVKKKFGIQEIHF